MWGAEGGKNVPVSGEEQVVQGNKDERNQGKPSAKRPLRLVKQYVYGNYVDEVMLMRVYGSGRGAQVNGVDAWGMQRSIRREWITPLVVSGKIGLVLVEQIAPLGVSIGKMSVHVEGEASCKVAVALASAVVLRRVPIKDVLLRRAVSRVTALAGALGG